MNQEIICLSDEVESLRENYAAHLETELLCLEQLIKNGVDERVLEQLHQRLHQLAGSAGIYGYDSLGIQARALNDQIQEWIKNEVSVSSEEYSGFAAGVLSLKETLSQNSGVKLDVPSMQTIRPNDNVSREDMLKILVVDDDKEYCELLRKVLEDGYIVSTAHTGKDALFHYQNDNPDITLLDIDLPDISGYEVCSKIKKLGAAEWHSTTFISANDTVQDRMEAFNAGGDDFIAKPFELGAFATKVNALAAYTQSKKQLVEKNQFAQTMVFETMAESAQYGHLVNFLHHAMSCENVSELIELFFEVSERFGLNTSLFLRGAQMNCYAPQQQPCSPIEINLFELMHKMGRLYHFGARTMVNDEHVSFLIKNMPIENEKEYGRIKDFIAVLSEAMETSYLSIRRKQSLSDAVLHVDAIQVYLSGIISTDSDVTQSLQRMRDLMGELEGSFHFLDLTEQQEKMLYALLEQGGNDAGMIIDAMNEMRENIAKLADVLQT